MVKPKLKICPHFEPEEHIKEKNYSFVYATCQNCENADHGECGISFYEEGVNT